MTVFIAGMSRIGPALPYLAGEISFEAATKMPLVASHHIVLMRIEVKQATYLHLPKTGSLQSIDPSDIPYCRHE